MLIFYVADCRHVVKKAQGQCNKLEHKFKVEKKRIYGVLYSLVLISDFTGYKKVQASLKQAWNYGARSQIRD